MSLHRKKIPFFSYLQLTGTIYEQSQISGHELAESTFLERGSQENSIMQYNNWFVSSFFFFFSFLSKLEENQKTILKLCSNYCKNMAFFKKYFENTSNTWAIKNTHHSHQK